MNQENALRLADAIEVGTDEEYPFNMALSDTCLIGHAARLQGRVAFGSIELMRFLGINTPDDYYAGCAMRMAMYAPDPPPSRPLALMEHITRSQAATFLRILVATDKHGGTINEAVIRKVWEVALEHAP